MNPTTLVLGASLKHDRYSNLAIHKLVAHEQAVIAVGLKEGVVAGIPIQTEIPTDITIDTVTLYLNPKRQVPYYDRILDLKPRRVIFNPGTENYEFYPLLEAAGIAFENSCTLVLLSTSQYD